VLLVVNPPSYQHTPHPWHGLLLGAGEQLRPSTAVGWAAGITLWTTRLFMHPCERRPVIPAHAWQSPATGSSANWVQALVPAAGQCVRLGGVGYSGKACGGEGRGHRQESKSGLCWLESGPPARDSRHVLLGRRRAWSALPDAQSAGGPSLLKGEFSAVLQLAVDCGTVVTSTVPFEGH